MNAIRWFGFLFLGLFILSGCTKSSSNPKVDASKADPAQSKAKELTSEQEAKVQAALAKLSDADRPLALAQKFCPIQKTRLGIMGKPDRIEIDGQPVFLCCSGCEDDARADPKKTLDQVAQLKNSPK
jgi:hypothetical protein